MVAHMVACVAAVVGLGGGSLVLHAVVLGPHRDGLRVYAVFDVSHPPLGRRHGRVVMPLPDLGRLAVATGLRNRPLDVFRADPRRVVADVHEIVLPVKPHVGYVRLGSQGSLHGVGAAPAVHAPEPEGPVARGGIVGAGLWRGIWINTAHRDYSSRTLRPLRLRPTSAVL